jgi:hypothetical protein
MLSLFYGEINEVVDEKIIAWSLNDVMKNKNSNFFVFFSRMTVETRNNSENTIRVSIPSIELLLGALEKRKKSWKWKEEAKDRKKILRGAPTKELRTVKIDYEREEKDFWKPSEKEVLKAC